MWQICTILIAKSENPITKTGVLQDFSVFLLIFERKVLSLQKIYKYLS
jgi:hypothetical protein